MDAYRKGLSGVVAEYAVKKAKSHRTVSTVVDKAVMDLTEEEDAQLEQAALTLARERLEVMHNPALAQLDAAVDEDG